MTSPSYDWTVDDAAWPPPGRPTPPFGPTEVEVLRACPLRACFAGSPGYERRLGFAARVGIALHRALQSLQLEPPLGATLPEVSDEARRRFDDALDVQLEESAARPRERDLPRDAARVERARAAVVVEAQRLARAQAAWRAVLADLELAAPAPAEPVPAVPEPAPADPSLEEAATVEVEAVVASGDGLFRGRMDRAERSAGGTILVDYKTGGRDDERHARQLQLYAYLWGESRGEWPVAAEVVYPFVPARRAVPVDPATCRRVAEEAADAIARLYTAPTADALGQPGETCRGCDFRPWCRPFWRWQAGPATPAQALERATLGVAGVVATRHAAERHLRLELDGSNGPLALVVERARFPHLEAVAPGDALRVVDPQVGGLRRQPTITAGDHTEVWIARSISSTGQPGVL